MGQDPDILVDLTIARNEFEAEVIVSSLEDRGIPARSFSRAASVLQLGVSSTQPIRVMVRRRDVQLAKTALRDIRRDGIEIDWSSVETGDKSPLSDAELHPAHPVCPACGFELADSPQAARCPVCGMEMPAQRKAEVGDRRTWLIPWLVGAGILAGLAAVVGRVVSK